MENVDGWRPTLMDHLCVQGLLERWRISYALGDQQLLLPERTSDPRARKRSSIAEPIPRRPRKRYATRPGRGSRAGGAGRLGLGSGLGDACRLRARRSIKVSKGIKVSGELAHADER